jgi:hypothetical protein
MTLVFQALLFEASVRSPSLRSGLTAKKKEENLRISFVNEGFRPPLFFISDTVIHYMVESGGRPGHRPGLPHRAYRIGQDMPSNRGFPPFSCPKSKKPGEKIPPGLLSVI